MTRSVLRLSGGTLVMAAAMTLTGLPRLHPPPARERAKDLRLEQLIKQSRTYIQAGFLQQVAETCERGLSLARAEGDMVYAVKFLNNLGGAEMRMFNQKAALDAFLEAKGIAEKQGDNQAISATALNLTTVYLQHGQDDLEAAERVADQGLKAAGKNDPYGFRSPLLTTLARLRWYQGKKPEALIYITEAIEAGQAEGHQNSVARAWDCLGEMRLDSGDWAGAEDPLAEGYRLRLLFHDPSLSSSYFNLSRLRLAQGDPASAANLLDRAVSQGVTTATVSIWYVEWLRGKILQAQNRPDEALEQFEKAVDAWQNSGEKLAPADAHRASFATYRKTQALFTSRIETSLCRQPAPHVAAFIATETYRAVSMQQSFAQSPAWRKLLVPEYWHVLNQLRSAQTVELATGTQDPKLSRLQQTLTEYEVRAGLPQARTGRNKTPEKYSLSETLRVIQETLDQSEALLSFYVGDSESAIWAVTAEGIEFHRLESQKVLSGAARQFRQAVEHDSPDRDLNAEQLYNQLFRDLSPAVQRRPFWLIAAADELFDIPMAALVAARNGGKPVYLVEKHATERIPSALMLRKDSAPPRDGAFLGVADGIYNVADPRWKSSYFDRRIFGIRIPGSRARPSFELARLAGSSHEIQACARIWRSGRAPVLRTGSQASREVFQRDLRDRPAVIHLAAHVISPKRAGEAVIDFGLSPLGQPDVLNYSDIANLDVQGSTVVVNGCASADGWAKLGQGAMGLTRAWLLAGAQTVVGSRWPIPDDSGALFESFYSSWERDRGTLPRKRIVAQSLRLAQLAAIHGNTWRSNPKYWSAFYVFGKE